MSETDSILPGLFYRWRCMRFEETSYDLAVVNGKLSENRCVLLSEIRAQLSRSYFVLRSNIF